jgi:hypothetical protein
MTRFQSSIRSSSLCSIIFKSYEKYARRLIIVKAEELTFGLRVRIIDGFHIGKIGIVIAKGTQTVLLDIGEPLLISEPPEHLEPAPEDPLPPGWEEVEI